MSEEVRHRSNHSGSYYGSEPDILDRSEDSEYLDEKQLELDILNGKYGIDAEIELDPDSGTITESGVVLQDFNEKSDLNQDSDSDSKLDPIVDMVSKEISKESSIMRSGDDEQILKSLSRSMNKEEILLTDSEDESTAIQQETTIPEKNLNTDVAKNKTSISTKTQRDIISDRAAIEIKKMEAYFYKELGIIKKETIKLRSEIVPIETKRFKPKNMGSVYASKIYPKTDSDKPLYASYIHLEPHETKFKFNVFDLLKEIGIIMVLHLYLGIFNAMFNVISIDGMLSCLIFYMGYLGVDSSKNFLSKNRLITIDRYIYYLLLFAGVYVMNYVMWFQYYELSRYVASLMICPSIMSIIYNMRAYAKVRDYLYGSYNDLIKTIVCKQMAKVINMFIASVLNLTVNVDHNDLTKYYKEFDFLIINKFIVTFILAAIFNHIDKGSLRLPLMIYKNLYLKDRDYNIKDDRKYLTQIIKDQRWDKFLDIYTLNRMIRMLLDSDNDDSNISEMIEGVLKKLFFRLNRVMFCWSCMSIVQSSRWSNFSLQAGILSFLFFTKYSKNTVKYILNVLIFFGISFLTSEKILILMLCELFFSITDSRVLLDISRDTITTICSVGLIVYENTRTETIFFSGLMGCLSFLGFNWASMTISACINLLLFAKFRLIDLNIETTGVQPPTAKSVSTEKTSSIFMSFTGIKNYLGIVDTVDGELDSGKAVDSVKNFQINGWLDIVKYVVASVKSNLLFKTLISLKPVNRLDLYRMLLYHFSVLVFGYISGYAWLHIAFLPILVQNIVDIVW